jgi:hypothetical protein
VAALKGVVSGHGFVADRLSPSKVTALFAPASATVSALLQSSERLDWCKEEVPALSDTASNTIMMEISSIEMTSE